MVTTEPERTGALDAAVLIDALYGAWDGSHYAAAAIDRMVADFTAYAAARYEARRR